MPERRPAAIFISYRGGDAVWAPDLVYSELAEAFGAESVFKAGIDLRAGDVYPPILEEMATGCAVMLVCIGPRWLAAQNADGTRRLDDADDWVRREIELALRNGNHVIPLLVGNLSEVLVPLPRDLPPEIAPLVHRQAFRLEPGGRLRITMPDLIAQLAGLVPGLTKRSANTVGGRLSSTIQIGTHRGKVTGSRAAEGVSHTVDSTIKINEVTETGEVTGTELLPCDPEHRR